MLDIMHGRSRMTTKGEACIRHHAWPESYDHRASHPYGAGTEHVWFSPISQGVGGVLRSCMTAVVRGRRGGEDCHVNKMGRVHIS